jgi:hypothetical protein
MADVKHDSILTFGLDMVEETEQNAGIILGETGKAGAEIAAASDGQSPSDREQAELEEARAAAEDARQREEAEKQREQEQERFR